MSFDRGPKAAALGAPPNPADNQNRVMSAARKRLATGGTQSSWFGSAASTQAPMAAPAPTVTGVAR